MKKDKSRDRKKSAFERDIKIKKVKPEKGTKNWKKLLDGEDE